MSRSSRRAARSRYNEPALTPIPFSDAVDFQYRGASILNDARYQNDLRPPVVSPLQRSLFDALYRPETGVRGVGPPRMSSRSAALLRTPGASRLSPHAKRVLQARDKAFNVLAIRAPRRVKFCVRRKVRREVLFAIRKNGRNGGRVYKRTANSMWRC